MQDGHGPRRSEYEQVVGVSVAGRAARGQATRRRAGQGAQTSGTGHYFIIICRIYK